MAFRKMDLLPALYGPSCLREIRFTKLSKKEKTVNWSGLVA